MLGNYQIKSINLRIQNPTKHLGDIKSIKLYQKNMKKNLFRLFALIVMASMFFGCKDSDNTPQGDPSKTIVTERDDCYDDGISYDGSIAILSKSHVDNIDEAAALRFLAGVTTEVTDNTVAAIVEGNPTDFVFDIGYLLDNGGAVFFYEPKASELKELVNHEYNILPLDEETIDAYDFDKIAVFGMTLDGNVYTCSRSEVEALETELVEVEQTGDDSEEYSYLIEDKGHDEIYDSEEYQMLAGIVEFLLDVKSQENSASTRAAVDPSKLDFGKIYNDDVLIPMRHSFDDHSFWSGTVGEHNVKGRFSAKFDITHVYDFDEEADFYLVKGNFTVHCNTFCKAPWQPYQKWRRHTVQGDVLRNVSMEAVPIPGDGFSVALARNAMPMNAPKEYKVNETDGFSVKGSANVGGSGGSEKGGKDGDVKSQEKKGGVSFEAGYTWSKSVQYTTHEWTVTTSSDLGNSVGYTISTDKEKFRSEWENGTEVIVNPHSMGNIDVVAGWVWQVKNTERNSTKKGIKKIRFDVKNLKTEWTCRIQALPTSETRKEQSYSSATIDIPLALTDRTEYGVLNLKNDLKDPITNIFIQNQDGKNVHTGDNVISPGETWKITLPTQHKYMIYFDAGQKAGQGIRYQYIKSNGQLLSLSKSEPKTQLASVNFADVKESTKASFTLTHNFDSITRIRDIKVYDVTDGKKVEYWYSKNGLEKGKSVRIYIEPNRKYTVEFSYKRNLYVYDGPSSESQYIMLKEAGDVLDLDADGDFVKQ